MTLSGEAPAKLNLFLHITGRRPDGFHTLETMFLMVSLADFLTVEETPAGEILRTGDLAGTVENDLCVRAALALRDATGCRRGARIHVRKNIPTGAGMGGGSSDAATALMLLNRLWKTGLSWTDLMSVGLKLGADIPFFIFGRTAFARGIGEILTSVPVPQTFWTVVMPAVPTPTAAVYADPLLKRDTAPVDLHRLLEHMAGNSCGLFGVNDLEPAALRINPSIGRALEFLGKGARMTGSGSAVFRQAETLQQAEKRLRNMPGDMRGWALSSLSRHPLCWDKMLRP